MDREAEETKRNCEFASHISKDDYDFVVNLVGSKCIISCEIDGVKSDCLWDTGAMVSMLGLDWIYAHLGKIEIRNLDEILDDKLDIEGVGGVDIPYEGYIQLTVKFGEAKLLVPFLVTRKKIQNPILGFNVVEAIAKTGSQDISNYIVSNLQSTFKNLSVNKLTALINFLNKEEQEAIGEITTYKAGALIRANSSISIPCRVEGFQVQQRTPVIFEPTINMAFDEGLEMRESILTLKKSPTPRVFITVTNNSDVDIKIPGRTHLGNIQSIRSITPANVQFKNFDKVPDSESRGQRQVDKVGPKDTESNEETILDNPNSTDSVNCNILKKYSLCSMEINGEINKDSSRVTEGADFGEPRCSKEELFEEVLKFKEDVDKLELGGDLSKEEQRQIKEMLFEERDAFAMSENDIGDAKDLKMEINTSDETPVQKTYNAIPRPLFHEVKCHIQDMVNRGWITKSKSAWSSPVVVVRKKSGDLRICCDFRQLNKKTIADKHPLPRIQQTLDQLGGKKFFTVLDQTRAYYAGYVDEGSRSKTAFVTPWGFYQWVRIPFGLRNAPGAFQRHMEETLSDFRNLFAVPYLDDVIIYSECFGDHVEHIRKVLRRLKERGMKLKLKKCNFFCREVKFLGRLVNSEGYRMDESSIEAVKALKEFKPTRISHIRQLLGLLGYHRRHICNFAKLAKPLLDLLLKKGSGIKRDKKG